MFILQTVRAGKGIFQIGVVSLAKLTRTGLVMDFSNTCTTDTTFRAVNRIFHTFAKLIFKHLLVYSMLLKPLIHNKTRTPRVE